MVPLSVTILQIDDAMLIVPINIFGNDTMISGYNTILKVLQPSCSCGYVDSFWFV